MTTPKYTYKGTDIQTLITTGTTALSGYAGFNYSPASSYSTERPLPLSIKQNEIDINGIMNSAYTDFNAPAQYTLPSNYNAFRAVLEGGGGGGGGGGGCGVSGSGQPQSRQAGAGAAPGANGGFTFVSDTVLTTNRTINITVGSGGYGGAGGGNKGTVGQHTSQPGYDGSVGGSGTSSNISFTTNAPYSVSTNAGPGGNNGQGGPAGYNATTPTVSLVTNTYATPVHIDGYNQVSTIGTTINPTSYKSSYSYLGGGGGAGTTGAGGAGGYVRIYLLKTQI